MKPLLILNDVHLGVRRMAGTTLASQEAVQDYLQFEFANSIHQHKDKDLCINGDLFDGFSVDVSAVLTCYLNLSCWLADTGNNLFLVAGNHDIGKRNDRLSSYDLLVQLLADRFYDQVFMVREELYSHGNIHMIPHCMNQDLFNMELDKALEAEPGFLLLHANVDNGFAENSDHSLNVDAEQLTRLSKRHIIMFAHEHQNRIIKSYKQPIFVMGNQWPSSISDCLAHGEAQKDGCKYAHVIRAGAEEPVERIKTWERRGDFEEMDWRELGDTQARFIRVTGKAKAEQASDVISVIAKYRQGSPAFVVSNAVQIESMGDMDDMAHVSFENIKAFDVLSALLEMLDDEEKKVVKELLNGDA